jgi:hypothetical protein
VATMKLAPECGSSAGAASMERSKTGGKRLRVLMIGGELSTEKSAAYGHASSAALSNGTQPILRE